MRICVIGKYPPIQGGVSTQTFWLCRQLAAEGNDVFVVTNADAVEPEHRLWLTPDDAAWLAAGKAGGGRLEVFYADVLSRTGPTRYIPADRPTTTQLAGIATEVVRQFDCDCIFSWYLEPYGVAAALVAAWTGRPYVIRHAGSDAFALATDSQLSPAYKEVLRGAGAVCTMGLNATGLGVAEDAVVSLPGYFLPPGFTPDAPPLDLPELVQAVAEQGWRQPSPSGGLHGDLPVVGMYGKLGASKGVVDLLEAVAALRDRGGPCVQLALVGGAGHDTGELASRIVDLRLAETTCTLPFIAPWHVPAFIRSCTAVAYLERGFRIHQHRPVLPVEVLACGRPLLLSTEARSTALSSVPDDDPVFDAIVVADPLDRADLTRGVEQVLRTSVDRSDEVQAWFPSGPEVAQRYEAIFSAAVTRTARRRLRGRTPPATVEDEARSVLGSRCPGIVCQHRDEIERLAPPANVARSPNGLIGAYRWAVALVAEQPPLDGRPLDDLARAELQALWLSVDVEGLDGIPEYRVPTVRVAALGTLDDDDFDALRPVTSALVRVESFSHDVLAHLTEVLDRPVDRVPSVERLETPLLLLLRKAPNLDVVVSRIGRSTAAFLASAGGRSTIADLTAALRLPAEHGPRFRRLVIALHDAGALRFRAVVPSATPGPVLVDGDVSR